MNELAHSRPHSDMIALWEGSSQDQALFGSWQILEFGLHVVLKLQRQFGSASVKMLINVCCASNKDGTDTRMAWMNWDHPKSPKICSIVSSRDKGRRTWLSPGVSWSAELVPTRLWVVVDISIKLWWLGLVDLSLQVPMVLCHLTCVWILFISQFFFTHFNSKNISNLINK